MKSFFSGSALLVAALLLSFLLFSAQPSLAETLFGEFQKQAIPQTNQPAGKTVSDASDVKLPDEVSETGTPAPKATVPTETVANTLASKPTPAIAEAEGIHYVATAYSLRGRTASGLYVSKGIIAADPRILPLGSRVRLEAGSWSGEYLVADTGGRIRGRKIDIWTPSSREAMRFGRRKVKLTVLSYPARRVAKKRA
jgi:3D (Asp-Asp-Asp) domain-containing protein